MAASCDSRPLGQNSARVTDLATNLKLRRERGLYLRWTNWEEQIYYAICHSFIIHSCKLCFARATCKTVINCAQSVIDDVHLSWAGSSFKGADIHRPS